MKSMNESLKIAVEEIEKELRRVRIEGSLKELKYGSQYWDETVLVNALQNGNFGDEVDEVCDAVEELRQENQVCLLSMTLQALHDDSVSFVAWTLPSGVSAYLVESWNGVPELFAIDVDGFSDERAANHLSAYIRTVYMGRDPEPDGPEVFWISPLHVEVYLETRTREIEKLCEAGVP